MLPSEKGNHIFYLQLTLFVRGRVVVIRIFLFLFFLLCQPQLPLTQELGPPIHVPPIFVPLPDTPISPFPHVYHRPSDIHDTKVPPLPVPASASNFDDADLHIPLALLKGKDACTKHPISNHVAYHHLTPTHQAFVTSPSSVVIPKT
ncbi:hypothetical protein KSP39_PZI008963 [Platanthera zijinensis]|uniref:Uncharacterized protein n=1 Tax=Platanthera zijinensis TaxID=2320716 RepID=A0AAP0BKP2_9ASPA